MMVNNETTVHILRVITSMSHGTSNAILNYDLNTYMNQETEMCVDMLFHKISYRISVMNELT